MRQLIFLFTVLIFVGCKPDSKEFIFPEGIIVSTLPVDLPLNADSGLPELTVPNLLVEGEIILLEAGVNILEHGFVWGLHDSYYHLALPDTINEYYSNEPAGFSQLGSRTTTGTFQSVINITGFPLQCCDPITGGLYAPRISVRAYAITNKGTAYGEIISFEHRPQVTMNVNTLNILVNEATLEAFDVQRHSDIGSVLDYGFVWLKSGDYTIQPTILDNKISYGPVEDISFINSFEGKITGLLPSSEYSYRAFVISEDGSVWYSYFGQGNTFFTPWLVKEKFPGETGSSSLRRTDTKCFTINNKAYYGFGYYKLTGSVDTVYARDFWEFDTEANIWTQLADFPGNVDRVAEIAFSVGGKGYYGLGYLGDQNNATFSSDIWEYDPDTDKWVEKTSFPGDLRHGQALFVIDNKAYMGIGQLSDFFSFTNDFWSYDAINNSWAQIQDYPLNPVSNAVSLSLDGLGYVGYNLEFFEFDNAVYDPNSNKWKVLERVALVTQLLPPFYSFSISGHGYLGSQNLGAFEFRPMANSWKYRSTNPGSYTNPITSCYTSTKGYIIDSRGNVLEFKP